MSNSAPVVSLPPDFGFDETIDLVRGLPEIEKVRQWAEGKSDAQCAAAVIEKLQVSPDLMDVQTEDGLSILDCSISPNDFSVVALYILTHRPDLERRQGNDYGNNALHWAFDFGCADVIEFLAKSPARLDYLLQQDNAGETPLHGFRLETFPSEKREQLIDISVQALKRNPGVALMQDQQGNTLMHRWAERGQDILLERAYLEVPEVGKAWGILNAQRESILMLSVYAHRYGSSLSQVQQALKIEPKMALVPTESGVFPLHYAASSVSKGICEEILAANLSAAAQRDGQGWTAAAVCPDKDYASRLRIAETAAITRQNRLARRLTM